MRLREDQLRGGRVRHVGGGRGEPLYPDVAVRLRCKVDVEEVVGRVLRMKRDAEQATLASTQHSARDIEKWRRLQHAVLYHANRSCLLDDEDPPVVERLRDRKST